MVPDILKNVLKYSAGFALVVATYIGIESYMKTLTTDLPPEMEAFLNNFDEDQNENSISDSNNSNEKQTNISESKKQKDVSEHSRKQLRMFLDDQNSLVDQLENISSSIEDNQHNPKIHVEDVSNIVEKDSSNFTDQQVDEESNSINKHIEDNLNSDNETKVNLNEELENISDSDNSLKQNLGDDISDNSGELPYLETKIINSISDSDLPNQCASKEDLDKIEVSKKTENIDKIEAIPKNTNLESIPENKEIVF